MEPLIALLGTMLFLFLVLAAAVEVILEMFRGVLERFGITWARGKVSLDEALQLASEFAPDNKDLHTKIEGVKSAAQQISKTVSEKISKLNELQRELKTTGADQNLIAAKLNDVANSVKSSLQDAERKRVFLLRLLAALVGCFLAWQSGFYVFQILASDPNASKWLVALEGLKEPWINILVGGLAAAAGSSYWHDQLDKVRSLKSVAQGLKKE